MARRHVRRSRADWKRVMAVWRESGLSQRAYCESSGISHSSFVRWRAQLEAKRRPSAFLRVEAEAAPLAVGGDSAPRQPAARVRVRGGVEVELAVLPDPGWILRLAREAA